ncbi:MAG: DEAD/DEAH box helicase [Candidatus Poribacteria bacterium]
MERVLENSKLEQILRFAPPKGTLEKYADRVRRLHHRFLEAALGQSLQPTSDLVAEMRRLAEDAYFLATQYTNPLIVNEQLIRQLEGLSVADVPPLQVTFDALALAGMLFEFSGDLLKHWETNQPSSETKATRSWKSLGSSDSHYLMAGLCYRLGVYEPCTAVLMGRLAQKLHFVENQPMSDSNATNWATYLTCYLLSGEWVNREDFEVWHDDRMEELNKLRTRMREGMSSGGQVSSRHITEIALNLHQIGAVLTQMGALYRGEEKGISKAKKSLTRAVDCARKLGDYESSFKLRALRDIFQRQWNDSPWTRLKDILPASEKTESYLEALIADGFVSFWTSQIRALEMRANLPDVQGGYLDERIKRVVISLPTSSGKTLLAELAIVKLLLSHSDARVIYVAPARTLCEQMARKLGARLEPIGIRVSTLVGDTESIAYERTLFKPINVLVITPEKLSFLFRREEPFVRECRLFIFDEIHTIGKGEIEGKKKELGRGWLYEEIVTSLLNDSNTRDAKMLFMSAIMPNRFEVRTWVDPDELHEPIGEFWQPTRLLKGFIQFQKPTPWPKPYQLPCPVDFSGHLFYVRRRDQLKSPFVIPNIITSQKWLKKDYKLDSRKSDKSVEHAVKAALKFAKLGTVLIYTPTKYSAEEVAKKLCEAVDGEQYIQPKVSPQDKKQYDEMLDFLERRLPSGHLLKKTFPKGIAFHHADLWLDVRAEIEEAFERGWLHMMSATSTLTEGVNFPVRTLLISDHRFRQWGTSTPALTKADFRNLAGRAGRARFETEGQVILIQNDSREEKDIAEFLLLEPDDDALAIKSSVVDEEVLAALEGMVEAIDEGSLTEKQVLSGEWGEHEKYRQIAERLQTFALLCSSRQWTGTEEADFISLIGTSFAGNTSDRATQSVGRFVHRNAQAICSIQNESTNLYAQTGFSIRSCRQLMDSVRMFWSQYSHRTNETLTREMLAEIAKLIYEIPETKPEKVRVGTRKYEVENPEEIFAEWIWEHRFDEIQQRYFSSIRKPTERASAFMAHIRDAINYKAPWGLSAFWLFLQEVAKSPLPPFEKGGNSDAPTFTSTRLGQELALLPAYGKFGVKTPAAVIFSALGLTPPLLTRALGDFWERHFSAQRGDFEAIMNWFDEPDFEALERDTQIEEWQVRRLARFVKRRHSERQTLRREWIVECCVHGWQYYEGPRIMATLTVGQKLLLEREPDNPKDANAVIVKTEAGQKLGYIPRRLVPSFAERMDRNVGAQAILAQIDPSAPPFQRLTIEVRFQGSRTHRNHP